MLAEEVGLDSVWVSETWGSDATVLAAWIAAHTSRIRIGTGILQMPARTPAAAAMAATTLDHLSEGRLLLGLGLSGPQVVEGWHGVPFTSPLVPNARVRSDRARRARARGPLAFDGEVYTLPVPGGPGRPSSSTCNRDAPTCRSTSPRWDRGTWRSRPRSPTAGCRCCSAPSAWTCSALPPRRDGFDVAPMVLTAIDDDVAAARDVVRPQIALYVGAYGSRSKNFYADLVRRYGFDEEVDRVQEAALDRRMADATAAVSDALVDALALVGPVDARRDRVQAYAEAGATSVLAMTTDPSTIRAMGEVAT